MIVFAYSLIRKVSCFNLRITIFWSCQCFSFSFPSFFINFIEQKEIFILLIFLSAFPLNFSLLKLVLFWLLPFLILLALLLIRLFNKCFSIFTSTLYSFNLKMNVSFFQIALFNTFPQKKFEKIIIIFNIKIASLLLCTACLCSKSTRTVWIISTTIKNCKNSVYITMVQKHQNS